MIVLKLFAVTYSESIEMIYVIDWSAIDQQYSEEQRKQRESQDQQQVYSIYHHDCILYTLHVAIQCLCMLHEPHVSY